LKAAVDFKTPSSQALKVKKYYFQVKISKKQDNMLTFIPEEDSNR
jgi:hypothetical protein